MTKNIFVYNIFISINSTIEESRLGGGSGDLGFSGISIPFFDQSKSKLHIIFNEFFSKFLRHKYFCQQSSFSHTFE